MEPVEDEDEYSFGDSVPFFIPPIFCALSRQRLVAARHEEEEARSGTTASKEGAEDSAELFQGR